MKKYIVLAVSAVLIILSFVLLFSSLARSALEQGQVSQEVMDLIKNAPGPQDFPGISAVYLLTEEKDVANEDGTASYRVHMIYKVLDRRAAPLGEINIPFNSDEATLDIDIARTITQEGKVINVTNDNIREVTPYMGLPLYSSLKLKQFSMPAIDVGSVVEYAATLKVFKPKMPGFFFSYWSFPVGLPVVSSTFEVNVPKTLKVNYASKNLAIKPEVTEAGDRIDYKWKAEKVFIGGIFEPFLPPYNNVCPNLTFATEKAWNEFAAWFYGISEPQVEATQEMKDFVRDVAKRKGNDREKIMKELYRFVSQGVRYVAMPLKASTYQPHKAEDIFRNKYGDCKDKAALLISLYRVAGIDAYFALLKTRYEGELIKEFPAFDFNHCIVAVPKEGGGYTFLDPTTELGKFGYVPTNLQDADILVVKKDGYEFVRLPLELEDTSGINIEISMKVAADYTIEASEKDEFYGDSEIMTRLNAKYATPDAARAYLERLLQSLYTKPRLIDFKLSDPSDIEEHFSMKFNYEVKDHMKEAGNLLIFDPPTSILMSTNAALSTEARTYPVFFPELTRESVTINLTIPPNCKINYLPKNDEKESPFGIYKKEISSSGNTVTMKYYYKSKMIEIPVGQYVDFKRFLKEVIKSLRESVVLEKI